MSSVATYLKSQRVAQRLSQEALAVNAGVSEQTVRRAETTGHVSDEKLRAICQALKIDQIPTFEDPTDLSIEISRSTFVVEQTRKSLQGLGFAIILVYSSMFLTVLFSAMVGFSPDDTVMQHLFDISLSMLCSIMLSIVVGAMVLSLHHWHHYPKHERAHLQVPPLLAALQHLLQGHQPLTALEEKTVLEHISAIEHLCQDLLIAQERLQSLDLIKRDLRCHAPSKKTLLDYLRMAQTAWSLSEDEFRHVAFDLQRTCTRLRRSAFASSPP